MSRKNVIKTRTIKMNNGPRIGESIIQYYRVVTHLAKDNINKNIKEAFQYLFTSYKEDSLHYIQQELNLRLKCLLSDDHNGYLDLHDSYIIVKYGNGSIYEYTDYDEFEEISIFELD